MTRNLLIRSSLWSFGGFGVAQILRLANNLIMTRLLAPEAFGLMALVTIIMVGLELFTDLGISTSVIQNKRGDDPRFVDTAWTIKVARGFLIGLLVCALALPMAWFYEEPQLQQILPVMALNAVFNGFASNAPAVANRMLWVGRLTVMSIFTQILSLAVMIIFAWIHPSVWAIVTGNLAYGFSRACLSHVIFPQWRSRFGWDSEMARDIIHFGKWIFLTSALTYAATQIDRLTLAKLMPFDLVGIYSIGFMWATLPHQLIQNWSSRVLFPFASQTLRDPDADQRKLTVYRRRVVWASALGLGLLGGIAEPAFHLLYTPRYWAAAGFFNVILAGTLIRILAEFYRQYNLALGQPKFTSAASGLSLLLFGAGVYPLYLQFGAHGIAAAYAVSQLGTYIVSAAGVRKAGLSDIQTDAAAVAGALALWAALHAVLAQFDWTQIHWR